MSKHASTSSKVIESVRQLSEWFSDGATPRESLVTGAEHEKLPFRAGRPVKFNGNKGLEKYLESFSKYGWSPVLENGRTIEMQRASTSLSLEPSGQIEHATAIHQNLHTLAAEVENQIDEAVDLANYIQMQLVGLGYHPVEEVEKLPRIPKSRYANFDGFMRDADQQSKKGVHVLYSTASAQANIGYESEADMVKKLRVTLALQPIVTAIFANSPFQGGQLSGLKSTRSQIIHNAAGGRYGYMLPIAFEEGFGFERFADYAMNEMPMLGFYRDGEFQNARGAKFADMMRGQIEGMDGHSPTLNDWENHLNCIWPEVRVRQFLEMRGADVGPMEMIQALPALWVGLTYDSAALDQAWSLVKDWSSEERDYLRSEVPVQGLQTPFRKTTLKFIAQELLAISALGLKARNIQNKAGEDESHYLKPLFEICESGKTWADRLIHEFENNWNGDIRPVFNAMSYANAPSVLRDWSASPPIRTRSRKPPKP